MAVVVEFVFCVKKSLCLGMGSLVCGSRSRQVRNAANMEDEAQFWSSTRVDCPLGSRKATAGPLSVSRKHPSVAVTSIFVGSLGNALMCTSCAVSSMVTHRSASIRASTYAAVCGSSLREFLHFIGSWASYGHNGLVSIIYMTSSTTRATFALLSSKFTKWDTACTLTFSVHAAPLWFQHPCCSLLFLKLATTRATCNPFAVTV